MPPINFEIRHPPNVTFGIGSFQKLPTFTHSYSKVAFVIGSRTLTQLAHVCVWDLQTGQSA